MPDWATINPPEGWSFSDRPNPAYSTEGTIIPRTLSSLQVSLAAMDRVSAARQVSELNQAVVRWASDNAVTVRPYQTRVLGNGVLMIRSIFVYPDARVVPPQNTYWPEVVCRYGRQHGYFLEEIICTHGGADEFLQCAVENCNYLGTIWWLESEQNYYCDRHTRICGFWHNDRDAACGVRFRPTTMPDGQRSPHCNDCDPPVACNGCGALSYRDYMNIVRDPSTNSDTYICARCAERLCYECGQLSDEVGYYDDFQDGEYPVCMSCYNRLTENSREEWEPQSPPVQQVLALENHPLRPVRTCSIELEAQHGGPLLAQALYNEGLTTYHRVAEYHHGREVSGNSFCYVERDSSIGYDGGELIVDRVNLDDPEEVEKLHRALNVVRELVSAGSMAITLRCGTHITVDGHKYGIGDVRNLVLATNYIEDPMYRLSSANYRYHRGIRYAQPVDKGPFETDQDFGVRFFTDNGHRSALNVSSYWQAIRNNCRCGANLMGRYNDCSCHLGKCAFEFRFFNGTSNFRNLHSWVALCQSLVAYAKASPDMVAEQFPPMEFVYRPEAESFEHLHDAWDERLRWIFKNLYFGPTEKESLRYTIEHCHLSELGPDRLRDIYNTPFDPPADLIVDQPIVKLNRQGATAVSAPTPTIPAVTLSTYTLADAANSLSTWVEESAAPEPTTVDLNSLLGTIRAYEEEVDDPDFVEDQEVF